MCLKATGDHVLAVALTPATSIPTQMRYAVSLIRATSVGREHDCLLAQTFPVTQDIPIHECIEMCFGIC